jgi:hypothetical protein
MNKKRIILGAILALLGIIGIASMLTMEIPILSEAEAVLKGKFTDQQIKFLILINPTILLLISVIIGAILYQKVKLKVPIIEKLVGNEKRRLKPF